jgi:hypothetical protein
MGVDYYQCDKCSFGFRDDSDYCIYCECGAKFCSEECSKIENYGEWNEDEETFRIDINKDITCICCRKQHATDEMLFQALLKHFKITRNQAFKIWEKQK